MRVFVSILILSGILFQTTAKLAILINFQINRDYIAKNLCVNRKKPESCCKGSCHLNKQLEEEEKKEELPSAPNLKNKFELMPFTLLDKKEWFLAHSSREHHFIYLSGKYVTTRNSVFHPPDGSLS